MPIWSEILKELKNSNNDFDRVRRKYLYQLQDYTKSNVILYASGWLQGNEGTSSISINDEDMQALMEVTNKLNGPKLDLILHSPGGSSEAAEALVSYLRSRFSYIRVIVPHLAMSAATMIACAADEIVMGKHSFLGPTDPQIHIPTPWGIRVAPAQAILDQFDRAQKECADPAKLASWLPMLQQYGPDLLELCENSLTLSRNLVKTWLERYMFNNDDAAEKNAESVAKWFSGHSNFKSHSRHLSRDELKEQGLNITFLEDDEKLQDLSLSVFHATTHTFSGTAVVKIVENHTGRAFIKQHQQMPAMPTGFPPDLLINPDPPNK